MRRRRRKLASWAVVAALFLNILSATFLPDLFSGAANAASPRMGEDVLVICTSNGLKFIRLDANGAPAPAENIDDGFCAFCQPFSHPILSAPATAAVTLEYGYAQVRLPVPCDTGVGIAAFSLRPLGSRAPPVPSI